MPCLQQSRVSHAKWKKISYDLWSDLNYAHLFYIFSCVFAAEMVGCCTHIVFGHCCLPLTLHMQYTVLVISYYNVFNILLACWYNFRFLLVFALYIWLYALRAWIRDFVSRKSSTYICVAQNVVVTQKFANFTKYSNMVAWTCNTHHVGYIDATFLAKFIKASTTRYSVDMPPACRLSDKKSSA